MISFIKSCNLENIKYKLLVLYLLNVTDIIFTLLLLSTGLFMEANILMIKTVDSLLASFMLKVILPAVLLSYLYFRMKKASEKQLKQSNILLSVATGVYAVINIFHLVFFLMFGFLKIFTIG